MNRDQKEAAVAEVATQIQESEAVFAVDYRGISVPQAAKALAQFRRENELLEFKGGVMNGEALSAEQIVEIARLPTKDVLYGQLVGMVASPITGLVRTLNALISGLAIQLKQIADQGLVGGEAAPATEAAEPAADGDAAEPAAEAPAADAAEPAAEAPAADAAEPASDGDAGPEAASGNEEEPA